MKAIGVLGGISDEDEHTKAGYDWVVDNLNAIAKIVNGLACTIGTQC